MTEGVEVAPEAGAVELPPTRYPSKGVSVGRVEVFDRDECDMVGLSAGTVAEAAMNSWSKETSVGRNENEYGNGVAGDSYSSAARGRPHGLQNG